MKNRLFSIVCLLLCVISALEARTITDFFVSEPGNLFPLLTNSKKMDLVDYLAAGRMVEIDNTMGTGTHLTAASDDYLGIQVSGSSAVEMLMFPVSKNDTVIMAITTVALPAKDSRIEFFDTKWNRLDSKKFIKEPTMNDFVVIPKGDKTKKETVLEAIDFPIICYSFDKESNSVIACQSLKDFMAKDEYEKIAPYLLDSLSFQLKGSKFVRL